MKRTKLLLKPKSWRHWYHLGVVFALFHKGSELENSPEKIAQLDDEKPNFKRIRCPLCQCHPKASNRWLCSNCSHPENFFNGCGTIWNTFTTRGLCPGCKHQWRWTACLNCGGWSLHEEWYTKGKEK